MEKTESAKLVVAALKKLKVELEAITPWTRELMEKIHIVQVQIEKYERLT